VISTGGGAPVDPRNRWRLYRGRLVAWLDAPPEILAQRIRRSPNPRPLLAGRDPIGKMRELAAGRARFYAPALRLNAIIGVGGIVEALERHLAEPPAAGATLLRADTPIGRYEIGDGNAVGGVLAALGALEARRAILVSEPRAWEAAGAGLADGLAAAGLPVDRVLLPQGEAAKRLAVVETAARELAGLRAERRDPLVAIGGGALGDTAGFLAATWLRGVPVIHVPTTLVAQIDSSIGGKTAVDLPEGKNLVGVFHQPAAIVVDVRFLRTLPPRQLRAALGEAVKMAALGDERLFELLDDRGASIAAGDATAHEDGSLAEVVERCGWAKVEVVMDDEREQGGRIHLNLGHSLGHAIETAAGFEGILHGEAVAYGLRAACRIGVAVETTPPERAARVEGLLERLGLGRDPLPHPLGDVLAALGTDKKRAGGRLRWVLPTATGVTVRTDVPDDVVEAAARDVLAGAPAEARA
jgi:3-dehydroquinate synthetase